MNSFQEILLYTKATIAKALTPTIGKVVGSVFYVIYAFLFDQTQAQAHFALIILIFFDFITGVAAAKRAGEPIRSSRIRHSAIKVFAYFLVIAGAHLAQKGIAWQLPIIDGSAVTYFLGTELISLIENVGKMGYSTPQKLLNQIRNKNNE